MLNISSWTTNPVCALQQLATGMAIAAPCIGDTKVPMSLVEKSMFINYKHIEDTSGKAPSADLQTLVKISVSK